MLFRSFLAEDWLFSPAIADYGPIYATTGDGKVLALRSRDGMKLWEFQMAGLSTRSVPSIAGDGTVYVGCDANRLYALDGVTGAAKWEFDTASPVTTSPAIGSDGTVYVGCADGTVLAIR